MLQHVSPDDIAPEKFAPPPHALGVGRLGIVEQLLADLDTVTHAGQHYTMGKIVGLLRDETDDQRARLSELQRRSIKRSLEELARDENHLLPDRDTFVARAQGIAELLSMW
jgi:hypothetical protein